VDQLAIPVEQDRPASFPNTRAVSPVVSIKLGLFDVEVKGYAGFRLQKHSLRSAIHLYAPAQTRERQGVSPPVHCVRARELVVALLSYRWADATPLTILKASGDAVHSSAENSFAQIYVGAES